METYEQKKRRLFGKQHLKTYLEELNRIVKIDVVAADLLSIIETDKICDVKISSIPKNLRHSFKILFEEKEKLREIISNYIAKTHHKVYVITSYSMDCGALKINSLNDFNFDFSFKDEHTGLISLIREDLLEKIVLDFYKEDEIEYLEIEIYEK